MYNKCMYVTNDKKKIIFENRSIENFPFSSCRLLFIFRKISIYKHEVYIYVFYINESLSI